MLLTTYEINKGDQCIVLTIKPIQQLSTISMSLRLDKYDIESIKKIVHDEFTIDNLVSHFIYTVAREYMRKITKHLVECTHFIADENLCGAIVQYCKQIDNDEIQIMNKETYENMYNDTVIAIKEIFGEDL